eukprot:4154294-Pleurochrysis_carterae.AAC.2
MHRCLSVPRHLHLRIPQEQDVQYLSEINSKRDTTLGLPSNTGSAVMVCCGGQKVLVICSQRSDAFTEKHLRYARSLARSMQLKYRHADCLVDLQSALNKIDAVPRCSAFRQGDRPQAQISMPSPPNYMLSLRHSRQDFWGFHTGAQH